MPFALIFIGLIMVLAGIKNTQDQLGALVSSEFTGEGNFFYWIAGLGSVGSLGYIPPLQTLSRALLLLILVVMILAHGGFWEQLNSALSGVQKPADQRAPGGKGPMGSATPTPIPSELAAAEQTLKEASA